MIKEKDGNKMAEEKIVEKEAVKEAVRNTTAQKAAQKKYDEKTKMISVKYTPVDMADYEKMRVYLEESGLSANQFIKGLIHTYFEEGKPAVQEKTAADAAGAQSAPEGGAAKAPTAGERSGVLPGWFD